MICTSWTGRIPNCSPSERTSNDGGQFEIFSLSEIKEIMESQIIFHRFEIKKREDNARTAMTNFPFDTLSAGLCSSAPEHQSLIEQLAICFTQQT